MMIQNCYCCSKLQPPSSLPESSAGSLHNSKIGMKIKMSQFYNSERCRHKGGFLTLNGSKHIEERGTNDGCAAGSKGLPERQLCCFPIHWETWD